jgi:primosomal protein N'
MFAEVVVDSHQDPRKRFFTYSVPKELTGKVKEGVKVLVPFGKRSVEGYIFKLKKARPNFPTKKIKEARGEAFSAKQIELARWMSDYYFASPLDCLKCQLPGRGQRYSEGKPTEIDTLLLIPYAAKVKEKALGLSRAERKTTLVGSRSTVFTTLPNLKKIVIEEPENWNYKDERSPYYHAKDIAQKRVEIEGLKPELKPLVPRVEAVSEKEATPPKMKMGVQIIDLQKERNAGNFSRLSSPAYEALKNLDPKGLEGLLYVNSNEVKKEVQQAIKEQNLNINKIEISGAEVFGQLGKKYTAVVMIDTDTLFNLPDFRAHEKLVTTVAKLSQLTEGKVYIQTASADHPLFEELKTGNLKSFYQRELEARKPFLYPPFGVLAKLEFSAKTTAKVESEANKLYQKLTHDAKPTTHNVPISPPYPPYSKTRGKAQLNIAVKAKTHGELEKVLATVPPTWRGIIDPESLL